MDQLSPSFSEITDAMPPNQYHSYSLINPVKIRQSLLGPLNYTVHIKEFSSSSFFEKLNFL